MHEEVILFKENKVEVLKRLKDGRVDYVDLTSWSFQDRLFGFLLEEKFFAWCASSYPTPPGAGEYPGLVSFSLRDPDEAPSERRLQEVSIYPPVGFDPDEGEL
jgi:hypothetical protein